MVGPGRRGYAIVAGRDVSSRFGEVVIERGLAQAWGIPLGGTLHVRGLGPPCAWSASPRPPTTSATRSRSRASTCPRRRSTLSSGPDPNPQVNVAEIWLRDPRYLNEVLVQARTTSYGLRGLRFVTRSGVRVLLDQAAGIVIDLLVALSVFALATAGVMLAASARAEVQRRLKAIGISRAVGASRGHLVDRAGRSRRPPSRSPPPPLGLARWACSPASGPSDRLLTMLNEPPAGSGLIPATRRRLGCSAS